MGTSARGIDGRSLCRFNDSVQVPVVEWLAFKKGRTKGKTEGMAERLLRILERRYAIKLPPDLDAPIRGTTDLAWPER